MSEEKLPQPTLKRARATKAALNAPAQVAHVDADPLDAFANDAEFEEVMAMMFWKGRFDNAQAYLEVTTGDLTAFHACMEYLGVTPTIKIFRPAGAPATAAIPAEGNRRAVPGRAARPPKDYVVIQMVDQDGNAIVPIENNEADHQRGATARRLKQIRDNAPQLAAQLTADVQANAISNQTILDAAEALRVLAASGR